MELALYAWGSSFRTLNSRNLIGTDLWKGPNSLLSSSYINVNKSYLLVHCFHREVPSGTCLCCVIHKWCSLGLLSIKVSQPLLHTPLHRAAQDLRAFLRFEECGANTARRWRRQGKAVRWCWAGQRVEFCEGGGGGSGVVGGSIATEQNADSPTSSRERLSRGSPRTRSRINK